MKQVIGGKVYNTETAEVIGSYSNNLSYSDFRNFEETLYLTKKGNYFLAGQGGPMTKYAESVGDGLGSGSDITPLSKESALQWAEQYCGDDEDVMEHFKDMIEEA